MGCCISVVLPSGTFRGKWIISEGYLSYYILMISTISVVTRTFLLIMKVEFLWIRIHHWRARRSRDVLLVFWLRRILQTTMHHSHTSPSSYSSQSCRCRPCSSTFATLRRILRRAVLFPLRMTRQALIKNPALTRALFSKYVLNVYKKYWLVVLN